jgi:glyoxylase-like metal-dependent hydrolase (beta-lactamase superfamily II)
MLSVEVLAPDLVRVRLPVPFPLGWVNVYGIRTATGAVLVDSGLRTPEALALLEEGFGALGLTLRSLRAVVVTHAHPDHVGLAGVLQQHTGAEVYFLDREEPVARRIWAEDPASRVRAITGMLRLHGTPPVWVDEAARQAERLRDLVSPFGPARTVRDGEVFELDGFRVQVRWTPGHSDGHMVLLDSQGRLFCGDHVLPDLSPNISLYPEARPDPLGDYLASLRAVRDLPVRTAYPGHGDPFRGWAERVDELLEHHRARLHAAWELLPPQGCTAFELARRLFAEHFQERDGLPQVPLPLAVGEAAAHLERLVQEGRAARDGSVPVRYRPVGGLT